MEHNIFRINRKTVQFLRTIKNVSVKELSEASFIGEALLYKIEKGRRKITPHANHRLVKGLASLGYTAEEIVCINMFVEQKGGVVN
ncbi:hypothetical protein BWGOE6_51310 [Bacillus mycoides]|uniref:helix-turn-helix domain-containing protein n=1 Tax=Bacillus mycoides TaxID=1405 RepID=UPI000873079D|nr:helix-turn-helix transcriptional regulator [Bacillus mycoides]OFD56030.1 hypothetical protein BWGOE6_51310 [Bacillus mycoides]